MYIDTEGLVLRQVKTLGGRRMITLLTEKYGKISAGTSINEHGKSKAALALRPFSRGRYEIVRSNGNYYINSAETLRVCYRMGENPERFLAASAALELTEKLLPEDEPAPEMLSLLLELLDLLEKRKGSFETLSAGFKIKTLQIAGSAPEAATCVLCGGGAPFAGFSISGGGAVCEKCEAGEAFKKDFFKAGTELFEVIDFIKKNPLGRLETLLLKPKLEKELSAILKEYYAHHLGISNLKSEGLSI